MADIVNSVGELLRGARKDKKLSLEDANRDTKISVKVLAALEEDDFEAFESDIYLKGFLRNYARYLGVDVDHAIRTMDRQRGGVTHSHGATWEIEDAITEEKLQSPKIFKRFVLPLLLLVILTLILLYAAERRKVKRLTEGSANRYLQTETVDSQAV